MEEDIKNLINNIKTYVAEQRRYNDEYGFDPYIRIKNLKGRCTDRISKKHLNSDELLVISHPFWDRLIYPLGLNLHRQRDEFSRLDNGSRILNRNRRIELQKISYIQNEFYRSLQNELLLEELIEKTSKKDIPIIFTVPTFLHAPISQPSIMEKSENKYSKKPFDFREIIKDKNLQTQIIGIDNRPKNYLIYLQSLISKYNNIYLLPTLAQQGVIIGDVYGAEDLIKKAEELTKRRLKTKIEDGKIQISLEKTLFAENTSPISIDLDIFSLSTGNLSDKDYNELEKLFSKESLQEITSEFWKSFYELSKNNIRLLSENPLSTPLINHLLTNNWERVYFAGGAIDACLRSTINYFLITKKSPELVLLEDYSVAKEDPFVKINRDNSKIMEIGKGLLHYQTLKKSKEKLKQILTAISTSKEKADEIELLKKHILKISGLELKVSCGSFNN